MSASQAEPGAAFTELVDVMDRLRRECPWTAQQTHASLARYLLEEAHETLEALDQGAGDDLCGELGDLLLQVVFHARIAEEAPHGWGIEEVVRGLTAKLIRRNPHVFGDGTARSVEDIDAAWQRAKERERAAHDTTSANSVLHSAPESLPALARAAKTLRRADHETAAHACAGEDLGSRFLALVAEANAAGADAEQLVRIAIQENFGP